VKFVEAEQVQTEVPKVTSPRARKTSPKAEAPVQPQKTAVLKSSYTAEEPAAPVVEAPKTSPKKPRAPRKSKKAPSSEQEPAISRRDYATPSLVTQISPPTERQVRKISEPVIQKLSQDAQKTVETPTSLLWKYINEP
jgi:hypothetical protein